MSENHSVLAIEPSKFETCLIFNVFSGPSDLELGRFNCIIHNISDLYEFKNGYQPII